MQTCIVTDLRREARHNCASFAAEGDSLCVSQRGLSIVPLMVRQGDVKCVGAGARTA
jgi:hypothetical protein